MESSKSPSYSPKSPISSPGKIDNDYNDDSHHSDSDNRKDRNRDSSSNDNDIDNEHIDGDDYESRQILETHSSLNDESNGNNNNNNNNNNSSSNNNTLSSSSSSTNNESILSTSTTTTLSQQSNNNNNNNINNGGSEQGNLFVNFLPSTVTTEDLRSMFSAFGAIESCRVMIDLVTGQSRGFGFVKFKDNNNANNAIKAMNGAKIEKKTLLVRHANVENSVTTGGVAPHVDDAKATNNLYIKGLPLSFTQEQLNEFFSAYGTILESKLLLDITTNTSRGQALVRFAEISSATKSIKALTNYKFPGADKVVIVRYADNEEEKVHKRMKTQHKTRSNLRFSPYPSPTTTPLYPAPTAFYQMSPVIGGLGMDPTNLYIYNLPADADDALLYRLFSPSGAIASVKVVKDPITQACKGFGFVRMVNLQDAINAINSVNGVTVEGKVLQVSFKK
ncbi:RNA-binding region RNP-1 domain-containing protein [Heterostelium album PN500]|uniref:RNA-binding region RNP-1 domain-containing protein n=1 Tax=Heterostelium pallidum (strain ATCC 26659 / Pp 5 / PN500) TaxID=670386 RepID=D3BJA5_HETP5|nr:RNA-binding region RNP-1 domain-containing protein [Heterostelium album PN500]EFA77985.1 RNA-binding region RNP-1 domain-containing protein [Heterostelium album PN500]|eukprot:XP_020430113.1 RNA-binding region RNP-1 domain-containing protein [Heterostelium album PN500]